MSEIDWAQIDWAKGIFCAAWGLFFGFVFGRSVGRNESIDRLRALDAERSRELRVIKGGKK